MVTRPGLPQQANADVGNDKWVNVAWMPHTALSQASHVCLTIRSAHATIDDLLKDETNEWKVSVRIYGVGGISLVPVAAQTPASRLHSRRRRNSASKEINAALGGTTSKKIYPTVSSASHDCYWDYLIQIPIRWRDLPRDAYLVFDIIEGDVRVYQGSMPFFSQYGKLLTGLRRILVKKGLLRSDINLGLCHDGEEKSDIIWEASQVLDKITRFEERPPVQVLSFGDPPSIPWLDGLTKARALEILKDAAEDQSLPVSDPDDELQASLIVELPTFDIPILFEETFYPVPSNGASGAVTPLDLVLHQKHDSHSTDVFDPDLFHPLQLVTILEYENENDNSVEDKYRTLAHDVIRGLVDPALKPDREQRARLTAIIDSPSLHPSREEKDLLWRFRFSLVENRRALTKFLLAVDWTVESEVVQAAELLEQWRKRSPIEVTDALKLLGKHVAFQTNLVRDYAIDTLAAAPDSELRLYLLQLVQALKYESNGSSNRASPTSVSATRAKAIDSASTQSVSSLAAFLINRAAMSMELANYLYWYLKVETQHPTHGSRYRDVLAALMTKLDATPFKQKIDVDGGSESSSTTKLKSIVGSVSKIGSTLRGTESGTTEGDDTHSRGHRSMWDVLVLQDSFISGLLDLQRRCRDARGKKDSKESELKLLLAKENYNKDKKRDPVPLPSSPEVLVNGVRPETAVMFKSALYPALLEFHVEGTLHGEASTVPKQNEKLKSISSLLRSGGGITYKVIVKTGDDLRQDQLVIMMIQLMDRLLKKSALDLCLSPYSIIATSPSSGLVEFVANSMPISQVLSKHNGSILHFFQSVAPQKGAKYDVQPDVMSTYIRSCAGYCVITYLLGVGDRHLDNILLRNTGHFFHIDFGFIFGRDPKPLPPAFRLTREMVDGMGGIDSTEYRQFCSLACQAYNALRKSASLVLNLVHLMADAEIEDLCNNPAGDADFVIASFEQRYRLDLTDEQAEKHFTGLITDCLSAIAPRVMDVFHSFAVARR
ncbi:phosphatidylinositol 3-kinase [Fistulifera solaris]|uniref:phosphatidylinositol 3-kinase n=1 Tax=Fistulifera solaris TaxID=1519565 RepID=A0A1Z5KDY1_FISSO|nr:phosphatidylinositol 3-kinase [Fistulifera solaris]|eukprot:GAX24386.1 phosphatidylinositol 3-kinase [Fistulifera solaris]